MVFTLEPSSEFVWLSDRASTVLPQPAPSRRDDQGLEVKHGEQVQVSQVSHAEPCYYAVAMEDVSGEVKSSPSRNTCPGTAKAVMQERPSRRLFFQRN